MPVKDQIIMNEFIKTGYLSYHVLVGHPLMAPYILYCHNQQEDTAGEEVSTAYNDDMISVLKVT